MEDLHETFKTYLLSRRLDPYIITSEEYARLFKMYCNYMKFYSMHLQQMVRLDKDSDPSYHANQSYLIHQTEINRADLNAEIDLIRRTRITRNRMDFQ